MGDFQGPTVNFPGDKDLNPRPPGLMARWPGVRKDCERKSHDLYMNQLQFSLVDDDQKRYATVCKVFFSGMLVENCSRCVAGLCGYSELLLLPLGRAAASGPEILYASTVYRCQEVFVSFFGHHKNRQDTAIIFGWNLQTPGSWSQIFNRTNCRIFTLFYVPTVQLLTTVDDIIAFCLVGGDQT